MAGFPSAVLVLLLCVVAVCSSVPVGAWWPQTPTSLLRTPTIRACVTSNERTLPLVHDVTGGRPPIEWYPGHIAKAERLMSEVLKMVDVVVELRDARIPHSTAHPLLDDWLGSRRHVVALNRIDTVPQLALSQWEAALKAQGVSPVLIDARQGRNVQELKNLILREGRHVNERRKRRGMNPRAIRCAILGYPNVGKSALINRLVGRTKAKSENRPGITRGFCWIRIDPQVQLLDSPGIIPAKQVTQQAAYHLAMCDDIGQAAYDTRGVAAALLETLVLVHRKAPKYVLLHKLVSRWGVEPDCESGEIYLEKLARKRFTGDVERAATTLLSDFRRGNIGLTCLEPPEAASASAGTRE